MTRPDSSPTDDPMAAAAATTAAMSAAAEKLPERTTGSDPTGVATAELDRAGVVQRLQVDAAWERHVPAEELGAAVVGAVQGASLAQFEVMRSEVQVGPWSDTPRLSRTAPPPAPVRAVPEVPDGTPLRPLGDLADAVVSLMRRFDPAALVPATGVGEAASGSVRVTLGVHGFGGCEIDPAWAARRSGLSISTTLGEALEKARVALAAAVENGAVSQDRAELDDIFAQAMAHLTTFTVPPDTTGRNV